MLIACLQINYSLLLIILTIKIFISKSIISKYLSWSTWPLMTQPGPQWMKMLCTKHRLQSQPHLENSLKYYFSSSQKHQGLTYRHLLWARYYGIKRAWYGYSKAHWRSFDPDSQELQRVPVMWRKQNFTCLSLTNGGKSCMDEWMEVPLYFCL